MRTLEEFLDTEEGRALCDDTILRNLKSRSPRYCRQIDALGHKADEILEAFHRWQEAQPKEE